MTAIYYRKANPVGYPTFVIAWSGGHVDIRTLPDFFTVDDSATNEVTALDGSPWVYRSGGGGSGGVD